MKDLTVVFTEGKTDLVGDEGGLYLTFLRKLPGFCLNAPEHLKELGSLDVGLG